MRIESNFLGVYFLWYCNSSCVIAPEKRVGRAPAAVSSEVGLGVTWVWVSSSAWVLEGHSAENGGGWEGEGEGPAIVISRTVIRPGSLL
jgi:hypothetical protein